MRVSFNPIFDSTALVLFIGAILFALLLLPPAFSSAQPVTPLALVGLRGCVIGLLIVAMLRPALIHTEERQVTSTVAVLLDTSRSMSVEDVGDQSRFAAMREAAERCVQLAERLGESLKFEFHTFAADLKSIEPAEGRLPLEDSPTGSETNIGRALEHLSQRDPTQRLGAVILMSDGAVRTHAPVVDLRRTATELARQGTALFPITFGRSRDQTEARDVALLNLPDQLDVFAKNRVPIEATMQVSGYVGHPIPVTMTVIDPQGDQQLIGPIQLTAERDGEVLEVQFQFVPERAGQYKLILSAAQQAEERVTDNNQLTTYLNVREGGLRVLFLCGNIGWQEQKFIRRSLAASKDIDMEFRWVDPRLRDQWPTEIGSTLDEGSYDVLLIQDVPADALGEVQSRRIAELTREGRGLMMIGGKFSFGPGNYADTPLAEVLPIMMSRLERQNFDEDRRADVHLEGPLRLVPRSSHFVTRLGEGDVAADWFSLPPLQGANRFAGLSPTGRVLLESSTGDSLLVASEYGLGRVLAFAGDSTYRWYRDGSEAAHKRFWRQAILWLARKDDDSGRQITITMDQRRFAPGARPDFDVFVTTGQDEAAADSSVRTFLVSPDGQKTTIVVARQPEGNYQGSLGTITTAGEYGIEAQYIVDGAIAATALLPFQVLDEDIEMTDATANASQMAMLAEITQQNGGRPAAAEQLAEVIAEIAQRAEDATVPYEKKWQLTDTPWDAWSMFLVMVTLLSTDWYCRKKWGMV